MQHKTVRVSCILSAEIMNPALPAAPTAPPRINTRQTTPACQADLPLRIANE